MRYRRYRLREREMKSKEHLSTRLEPELLERLRKESSFRKVPITDIISLALDVLEREENLAERMRNVEIKLESLFDMMSQKLEEASINEKERLVSLLQLIERKLQSHDQAEQLRFDKITHNSL